MSLEVTHISTHGVCLLSNGRELFMPYDDFPWFKDASVGKIINVEEPSAGHFYWPELDVDLSLGSIERPEDYPLKAKLNTEL